MQSTQSGVPFVRAMDAMLTVTLVTVASFKLLLVLPIIFFLAFLFAIMIAIAGVAELGVTGLSKPISVDLGEDLHNKVSALISWTGINTFNN